MKRKDKAVYAHGELGRVRDKLGNLDRDEAKLIAEKIGGKIGYERSEEEEKALQSIGTTRAKRGGLPTRSRPGRSVELLADIEDESSSGKKFSQRKDLDPADDPSVPIRISYWERIKMDRFAGQPEFEIKSAGQVLLSIISPFSEIPDYVNPFFITNRMNEYYKKIEVLVTSTRTMLPRNNMRRSEKLKKGSPLAYSVLDVIRYWDIEKISGNLAKIQNNPKGVRVSDLGDILKAVYKPLYILERLNLDVHIRGAYKILYKLLQTESQEEAQNSQELIRTALASFSGVRREIRYLLYPLLMKSISATYLSYDIFFAERKNRLMAFLNVNEADQMNPADFITQDNAQEDNLDEESQQDNKSEEASKAKEEEISEEEMERRYAKETEKKALDRGIHLLETLFPQAGWEKLSDFPDLYPYFADILELRRGVVYIAPTDPMLQVLVLMRILEELFFGLRHATFSSVPGLSGNIERIDTILMGILNDWRYYREISFEKEYLPRMVDYVRILEGSMEERTSNYTKKLISELHWTKRTFLLPFYRFDNFISSPFQKKDSNQIYTQIRTLRKYLAAVAAGIEKGVKAGGAETQAPCDGIDNPWAPYVFQVSNPVSVRLDALLSPRQKNNASLVYFSLAVASVLDHLVNNENSWAYSVPRSSPLFRSVNGEGVMPLTGVDKRIDANTIFKQVQRQKAASKK